VLAKPTPTELCAPLNSERALDGQRSLFCVHYDGCLDEAVKRGWGSWCCTRCELAAGGAEPSVGLDDYAQQRKAI
jgi:hypothetical protein